MTEGSEGLEKVENKGGVECGREKGFCQGKNEGNQTFLEKTVSFAVW